jgi:hypothetical protein
MNRSVFSTSGCIRILLAAVIAAAAMVLSPAAFAAPELPAALSSGDLQQVMKWIGQEVSNQKQTYCYRQSQGRDLGSPMKCAQGLEEDAGLCYTPCKAGYKGVGPVCWQKCTPGFRDDGAFCFKPQPRGRGTGYAWQWGDGFNDDGMRGRCEKDHGKGNCEKNGLIYYPKCGSGFHNVGCCICSPDCPPGQPDIGVSCAKKSEGRGVGKPLSACPPNKEKDGLLCYDKCASGFHGVGPVCWQNCPPNMVDCGAGCAASKEACVTTTANMVMPGLELAVKITKSVPGASMLESQFKTISQKMKQLSNSGMNPQQVAQQIAQMGTLPFELNQQTMQWVNGYVGNFANMTTPKVFTELPKHFSGDQLTWVKQQFSKNHLALMLKQDGLPSPQNLLSQVTSFDPLQMDVVLGAFAKPVCQRDIPFPIVKIIQQVQQQLTGSGSSTSPGSGQPDGASDALAQCRAENARLDSEIHALFTRARAAGNISAAEMQQFATKENELNALQTRLIQGGLNVAECRQLNAAYKSELAFVHQIAGQEAPGPQGTISWVAYNSPSASRAFLGGSEAGKGLAICRAAFQGGVHPGKVVNGKCNIGWGGREYTIAVYEVLVSNNAKLAWAAGPEAARMVQGGQENGKGLYVCRAAYQNGFHPGKIVNGKCNFGWGGGEIIMPSFQVLVLQ